jgi:hypothetical protein
MEMEWKLPVGIEDFEKIRNQGFYYVDKTGFIIELLEHWGAVNLFTCPGQFGKSLNMSMLKSFFEIGCKKELFDGLKIALEKDLCEKYMGQFPVISISLKNVDGLTYPSAIDALKNIIGTEALRFQFLKTSENLSAVERKSYEALISIKNDCFTMPDDLLIMSLQTLSRLLDKHYGCPVIVLIDAYDAPLDKAFRRGYYDEMKSSICRLLTTGLKTNPHLQFSVLAGTFTDFKGSILNLNEHSITDKRFERCFGFTDEEVKDILTHYGLSEKYDAVKEWCGGYRFGNAEVYCPEAVISCCEHPYANMNELSAHCISYIRDKEVIKHFLHGANKQTRDELERLIAGKTIVKEIQRELAFNEQDSSIENRWNVLVTTGCLTIFKLVDGRKCELAITNQGIRQLIVEQVEERFQEIIQREPSKLDAFCDAFLSGDAAMVERLLNDYLWDAISVRGEAIQKENFCYQVLLGLLCHKENWLVQTKVECRGEEYSNIFVEIPELRVGVVIGMKYVEDHDRMENGCDDVLSQIHEKQYDAHLLSNGMQTVLKYGISCYRKYCIVRQLA